MAIVPVVTKFVVRYVNYYLCFERDGASMNLTPSLKWAHQFDSVEEANRNASDPLAWCVTFTEVPPDFMKDLKIVTIEVKEICEVCMVDGQPGGHLDPEEGYLI